MQNCKPRPPISNAVVHKAFWVPTERWARFEIFRHENGESEPKMAKGVDVDGIHSFHTM